MYSAVGDIFEFVAPIPSRPHNGWLTPRRAAHYLDMSKATFYRKIKAGHLPKPHKASDGSSRFRVEDLDAYASGKLSRYTVTALPDSTMYEVD